MIYYILLHNEPPDAPLNLGGDIILRNAIALAGALAAAMTVVLTAENAAANGDHETLHFGHPMITESPSPDTKLRFDWEYRDLDAADRNTLRLEGEYAFAPWISVEADLPYTFLDPDDGPAESNLDNMEIALKLATDAFAEQGLILGGGLEIGLPTGDDEEGIGGSKEIEIAPFIDAGLRLGKLETVAFVIFEIPTNEPEEEKDEVDLKIAYRLAFTYPVTSRAWAILEFDGEVIAAGDKEESVLNISPGVKVQPLDDERFIFGASVSVPLTDDKDFDVRALVSGFYHF